MELWLTILDFPGYSVSNYGRVRNDITQQVLTLVRNQSGVAHVGMVRHGVQCKRGVARLVADQFLPHTTMDGNPTPIHLDADRSNNAATNLDWRPKWFADQYTRQWKHQGTRVPSEIMDIRSGIIYDNSTEAARRHGLLEDQIVESIREGIKVYPTLQIFQSVT